MPRQFLRAAFSMALLLSVSLGTSSISSAAGNDLHVATFAGGCFWCVEADFDHVPGVERTISGYTGAAQHADSPLFDVPVEQLRARWREVAAAEPRVELLAEHGDGWQFDYVQRSARFRYPDIVTVRFIAASATQSTLAIYSRSIYGRSDFGVNRARIETWLARLREGF